jgi:hypothetical protein
MRLTKKFRARLRNISRRKSRKYVRIDIRSIFNPQSPNWKDVSLATNRDKVINMNELFDDRIGHDTPSGYEWLWPSDRYPLAQNWDGLIYYWEERKAWDNYIVGNVKEHHLSVVYDIVIIMDRLSLDSSIMLSLGGICGICLLDSVGYCYELSLTNLQLLIMSF